MAHSEDALRQLSRRLDIEALFLKECMQAAVVEIQEIDGTLDLAEGTTLRLRRLQRICHTFNVDLHVALLLAQLSQRAADLEREVEALRRANS